MSKPVTGIHAVEEALASGSAGTLYISKKGPKIEALIKKAKATGGSFKRISPQEMDKLAGEHRGFCFVPKGEITQGKNVPRVEDFLKTLGDKEQALVILLDGITDPHNLGAILRSADLLKADLVVLPSRRSASENDTVARTSSGAVEWVPLLTAPNLSRVMEELQKAGFWIYGAHMEGEDAASLKLGGRVALVMGSEGKGLSRLVKEHCDGLISIPTGGHVDSFNVSVAAGILMYEVNRQRG